MSPLVLANLVAASLYLGFQATVHVVVYRQFAAVPPDAFARYEREHQRRITFVVGPFFAASVLCAAALLVRRPADVPAWAAIAGAILVAAILAVTGLLAVPLHRRLSAGWDPRAFRRLLLVDGLRLALAVADVVVAASMATG